MSEISPAPTLSGAKLPLRPMHVWGIRVRLQVERRIRDLALFDLAIDSKLRGCDVVALRIGDVVSAGTPRRRAMVLQQKTGRPVQFEITDQTRQSIARWLERRPSYGSDWLFPSRLWPGEHLSTRQYSRLVKWWVELIGLEPSGYGTHNPCTHQRAFYEEPRRRAHERHSRSLRNQASISSDIQRGRLPLTSKGFGKLFHRRLDRQIVHLLHFAR